MRFRSTKVQGIQVYAVAGTNTVSFGIRCEAAARKKLLGFAVERIDPAKDEQYYVTGFKVFPSVIPSPNANTIVSTFDHPIQSLVWDDFTAAPGHTYTYVFHPLRGRPKNLDRSAPPVPITVTTEVLVDGGGHDVFFNRGVASSQAYASRFHNLAPNQQPTPELEQEALDWLGRDLEEAIVRFIRQAEPGDALRGCFYEFRFQPVADELRAAIDRGVDVQLIIDEKVNAYTEHRKNRDGTVTDVFHESFPRVANLDTIKSAMLPAASVIAREARAGDIAHNKFMVWLKGAARTPTAVWTGSTNLSQGAIYGQANVGHWVRDGAAATVYLEYWNLLSGDPGGRDGDDRPTVLARNRALRDAVATLSPLPVSVEAIAPGVTPVFSPRAGLAALDLYASLIGGAARLACITFAFTIAAPFKTVLEAHTTDGPLSFLLLEKEDRPGKAASAAATETFVRLNSTNNVYEAFGSDLRDPLGQWVMETDTRQLGLNEHVMFIHCKFLLRDPLGADPIIVTGSANFSKASTNDNDENMMIIRGDRRAADIYFTEFNRLWNHYYFRSVVERTERFARTAPAADRPVYSDTDPGDLSLTEDDSWLAKYRPGTLRTKRVGLYTRMSGTVAT